MGDSVLIMEIDTKKGSDAVVTYRRINVVELKRCQMRQQRSQKEKLVEDGKVSTKLLKSSSVEKESSEGIPKRIV